MICHFIIAYHLILQRCDCYGSYSLILIIVLLVTSIINEWVQSYI